MEEDKVYYSFKYNRIPAMHEISLGKQIGEISICGGALRITIRDTDDFIRLTEEQIKNLHELFGIDVTLFDED